MSPSLRVRNDGEALLGRAGHLFPPGEVVEVSVSPEDEYLILAHPDMNRVEGGEPEPDAGEHEAEHYEHDDYGEE